MARVIADRHPWALGRPAIEVRRDSWHIVGQQLEAAYASGEGYSITDQRLPMWLGRRSVPKCGGPTASRRSETRTASSWASSARGTTPPPRCSPRRYAAHKRGAAEAGARVVGPISAPGNGDLTTDTVIGDARMIRLTCGVDPRYAHEGSVRALYMEHIHPDDYLPLHHRDPGGVRARGAGFGGMPRGPCRTAPSDGWRCRGEDRLGPDGRPQRFPGITLDTSRREAERGGAAGSEGRARVRAGTGRAAARTAGPGRRDADCGRGGSAAACEVNRAGFFQVIDDSVIRYTAPAGWMGLPPLTGSVPTASFGEHLGEVIPRWPGTGLWRGRTDPATPYRCSDRGDRIARWRQRAAGAGWPLGSGLLSRPCRTACTWTAGADRAGRGGGAAFLGRGRARAGDRARSGR